MNLAQLQPVVDAAWDARDSISPATTGETRDAVDAALNALDNGSARVAEKTDGGWIVNQWLKKAVLLSFRLNDMTTIAGAPATIPTGMTRSRANSKAGGRNSLMPPDFAPFPTASSAAALISPPAPC